MIFPCDAITISFVTPPNSGVVILAATSTNRTILNALDTNYGTGGDMYLTDDSDGTILVDSTNVLRQDNRYLTRKTKGQIVSHNTSMSGNSSGQVVYVDRDISATSTLAPACENQRFTGGEIVISIDLFLILTVLSMLAYHVIFRRLKIKNQ